MGTPRRGRFASIKKGSSLVANMGSWSLAIAMDEIDASVFGSDWKKNMAGMQGWSADMEGFFDPDDTTQKALHDAALAGTLITDIKLYTDDTEYWAPDTVSDPAAGGYITNFGSSVEKSGLVKVTFKLSGFGPIKYNTT